MGLPSARRLTIVNQPTIAPHGLPSAEGAVPAACIAAIPVDRDGNSVYLPARQPGFRPLLLTRSRLWAATQVTPPKLGLLPPPRCSWERTMKRCLKGTTDGYRNCEVLQYPERLRLHSAGRRLEGRVRAHHRGRAGWHAFAER